MLFFLLPVGINRALYRRPVVTYALLLINLAVFLAPLIPDMNMSRIIGLWGVSRANWASEPWRLLTHAFVHAGLMHFLFNMLYLYLTGAALEDRIGRPRTILLYLLGATAGAALQLALIPRADNGVPLVGASGAIAAFMGAFCVVMPWSEFKIFYAYFFFPRWAGSGAFRCPALLVLGFYFFFFDLLSGVFSLFSETAGPVAHWAHVGGFVFGAASAAALYGLFALFHTEAEEAERKKQSGPKPGKPPRGPVASSSQFSALLHFILIEDVKKAKEEYRRLRAAKPNLVLPPEMQSRLDSLFQTAPAERIPPPPSQPSPSRFTGLASPARSGFSVPPARPTASPTASPPAAPSRPAPATPARPSQTSQYTLRPVGEDLAEPGSPPPEPEEKKPSQYRLKDEP